MVGPTNFHIGAGSLSIDGADVGLTTENGIKVKYTPDIHMHMSGKYGSAPVKASYLGAKLELEIEMGEFTMDNILNAYSGVLGGDGKIEFGGLAGRQVSGHALILTPFDGTNKWYFRNAIPTGAVEADYSSKNERLIKVTFEALVDTTAPDNENLGYVS